MKSLYCLVFILFITAAPHSLCASDPLNPHVVLETNFGDITLELFPAEAPITTDNFLNYVNSEFYNGLLFHRVIYAFMIQGGAYFYYNNGLYYYPPNDPIINESYNGLSNLRGTLAMARSSLPDSATSQFFINHVDNLFLDRENAADGYGYCVFGKVTQGMNTVDAIALAPTIDLYPEDPTDPFSDFPNNPMIGIYSAYALPCDTSYCSDTNSDGFTNLADFVAFASHWLDDGCGSANNFCDRADLDYNFTADIEDLTLFMENYLSPAGREPQFSDLYPDENVNINDLAILVSRWLSEDCDTDNDYCSGADINHNGTVDISDFHLLSTNWLTQP